MIEIKVNVSLPDPEEIRSRFGEAEWEKMKVTTSKDMQSQVSINLIRHGQPSGDWEPLSGFGESVRRSRLAKIVSDKSFLTHEASEGEAALIREQARYRRLQQRQDAWRARSRHTGYAKKKDTGKTPGKGRFSAGVRLRDTGALRDSIRGVIDGNTIRVEAEGQEGDRPTNQELLEWHATGAGNLPTRNPAQPEDMENFEARTRARLEELLRRPIPTKRQ